MINPETLADVFLIEAKKGKRTVKYSFTDIDRATIQKQLLLIKGYEVHVYHLRKYGRIPEEIRSYR